MATNHTSLFDSFNISLDNGMDITGLKFEPKQSSTRATPLIVLIHGGGCTSHNFDVDQTNTASSMAAALSIPLVAINRPGYLGSTPMPEVPADSTYYQEHGKLYHQYLFPRLWKEFGSACTGIVVLAHSLGSPATLLAASLHARDASPAYPLAGIIMSGWGVTSTPWRPVHKTSGEEHIKWKIEIMTSSPHVPGLCRPEIEKLIERQDVPMPDRERGELLTGQWFDYWRSYAEDITCPVMWELGQHDAIFHGTEQHMNELRTFLPKTERWAASVVAGAPHAMEWWKCSEGWYARCFGFAIECCGAESLRDQPRIGAM